LINRLKKLYELQLIDTQLDELESLRGDLPRAVTELQNRLKAEEEILNQKVKEKEDAEGTKTGNLKEMERLNENLNKFKADLYRVRNNKEYDALTKQIDQTEEEIKRLEAHNETILGGSGKMQEDIDEVNARCDELKAELAEKEEELNAIVASNEKEERKLMAVRNEIQEQVKKQDYSDYMRIRKARKGLAVATIRRSACSGCHNIIPSQKQLEIRRNTKIFVCEFCGRILVSAEIAGEE